MSQTPLLKHSPQQMITCLALIATIFIFDQLSKYWMVSLLSDGSTIAVMPGLQLSLAYNTGVAFSFFSNSGSWERWGLVLLALLLIGILGRWLWRVSTHQKLLASSLSMIIGGALGNVFDRIQYGYVIDFLDVYYKSWHWPTFNVADSSICLGAILLSYIIWTTPEDELV